MYKSHQPPEASISPDDLFLLLESAINLLQLGSENVPQVGDLRLHHRHHLLEHLQETEATSQSNLQLPVSLLDVTSS